MSNKVTNAIRKELYAARVRSDYVVNPTTNKDRPVIYIRILRTSVRYFEKLSNNIQPAPV